MPWSIEKRDDKFCVVKDDDGEVEGCHDTRQEALDQQRALYASEGKEFGIGTVSGTGQRSKEAVSSGSSLMQSGAPQATQAMPSSVTQKVNVHGRAVTEASRDTPQLGQVPTTGTVLNASMPAIIAGKAGARHNKGDQALLQTIHDNAVDLGAVCDAMMREEGKSTGGLFVFKDTATGKYRWVLISSSAFEDRDKQIVSTKALEDDEWRMDTTKQYGPLRWWHVGEPDLVTKEAGPGWDFGPCDFSAMHGHMRVESGLFDDDDVALGVKAHADELGSSIGFFHPTNEPVQENGVGVYHNIQIFERSLLPREKASNLFTQVMVGDKEEQMLEGKKEALTKLLGAGLASRILGDAEMSEKAAAALGIAYKDADPVAAEEAAEGPPAEESPPAESDPVGELTVGQMKAGEFAQLIAATMQAATQPLADGLAQLAGAVDIGSKLDGHLQAVSKLVGGALSTKEEADRQAAEAAAAKQAELDQRLKELEGGAPAEWWMPVRPSRSEKNVLQPGDPLKSAGPQPDKAALKEGESWIDQALSEVHQAVSGRA